MGWQSTWANCTARTRYIAFTWFVEQVSSLTYITEHETETKATSSSSWCCCLPWCRGVLGLVGWEEACGHGLNRAWAPVTFSCLHSQTKGMSLCTRLPQPRLLPVSSSLWIRELSPLAGFGNSNCPGISDSLSSSHGTGKGGRITYPTYSWSELSNKQKPKKNILKNHQRCIFTLS